jgi:hypothetical protein
MLREQVAHKEGETTMRGMDGPSVRESREEKRLEDRLIWIMLLCGSPLLFLAGYHESFTMLILSQAYLLTFTVAGILGIKRRAVLKQKWFLNAMACSLPVHIAAIASIFYWDKANLEVAFKGFYTVGVVWVAGVVELVVIVVIMEFWEHRTGSAF